jgi:hypothetical protein
VRGARQQASQTASQQKRAEQVEQLASRLYDDGTVSQIIRPAAVLSEANARRVLQGLEQDDVRSGGRWHAEPGCWRLFERPWKSRDERSAQEAGLIGSIQVAYGMPTRYEITIFRATVTVEGTRAGFTVESLCDAALRYADLTLSTCPRIDMQPPPRPFSMQ